MFSCLRNRDKKLKPFICVIRRFNEIYFCLWPVRSGQFWVFYVLFFAWLETWSLDGARRVSGVDWRQDDELDPGSQLFFLSIAAVGKSLHVVTCCQSRRSIRIFELNERILNFNHNWLKYLELSRTESFPIELNCWTHILAWTIVDLKRLTFIFVHALNVFGGIVVHWFLLIFFFELKVSFTRDGK